MNENSSQTIKELSEDKEDKELKNLSESNNDSLSYYHQHDGLDLKY